MSEGRARAVWSALQEVPGVGPKTLARLALRLREDQRSVTDLVGADPQILLELGLPGRAAPDAARRLADPPAAPRLPADLEALTPEHPAYPHRRLDPRLPLPVVLYAHGNPALLERPALAVAGSRTAPPELLECTATLARAAVAHGLTVVSGNARGVDRFAHRAAVGAGGTTIVVPAEGPDRVRLDPDLRDRADRVLVASPYPPGTPWSRHRAMERNTTIAALADAVVIVAAGTEGGSWAQGRLCLATDKPLFVAKVDRDLAPGNEELIERGAIPFDPSDPNGILTSLEEPRAGSASQDQLGLFGD